jgi:hypothetical protein
MLGNLKISYKLLMMIGLSVLGIAVMSAMGLSALWGNLMEDRRAKLQDIVTVAREALDFNYQASRQAGLSEADAMERGKALLRTLRFGKDDYVYAINTQGKSDPRSRVVGKARTADRSASAAVMMVQPSSPCWFVQKIVDLAEYDAKVLERRRFRMQEAA